MAPLDGAFAFSNGPYRAVLVGEHLDLDVMAGCQVALAEHRRIAERRLRLAAGRLDLLGQLGQFADHPHTATTAACRGLDENGQLIRVDGFGIELVENRHSRGGHHLLGLDLGAHRRYSGGRRADPCQARVQHGGGEFGVLREESVAGVDRVRTRRAGRGDQLLGIHVPVATLETHPRVGLRDMRRFRVGVGVDGDGADADAPAGGEHPAGDLATVGDQNLSDHVAPPTRRV